MAMTGWLLSILLAAQVAAGSDSSPVASSRFAATSQRPAPALSGPTASLPMSGDLYRRMTVPVRIGGKGPFRFLVDTGSDRSAISRELAGTLALDTGQHARLHSATGETRVLLAVLVNLTLSRRSIERIDAPLLDAADIGADGILGIDALRAERLTFDFVRRTVAITSADGVVPEGERDAIIVRAKRRDGRLVITDASADDQHVSVVVDTGSQYTVGNDALRRSLGRRGALDVRGPVELVSVTGAVLRGEMAIVRNLKIGGTTVRGLAIVFADAHTFRKLDLDRRPAILLGMNGLASFDQVSIDFAGRKLRLVVSTDTPPSEEH